MITRLVITDLTRMYHGNVCLAGYTSDRRCVRPVTKSLGIPENSLYLGGGQIISPFSVIEIELKESDPHPPHTEDTFFELGSISYVREVQDRESVLSWSLFENVEKIFEQEIRKDPGYYILDCQGPRSLGTIRPANIHEVKYESSNEGVWDYRLGFYDESDKYFRLKIVDLTWQYYCDSLRDEENGPAEIAKRLTRELKKHKVYIRIGLARGWKTFPERCYLQITGIYTFPDYLEGRKFAHFSPKPRSI